MPAVTQIKGDLLEDSENGSILLHSCNAQGSWGSGVALALKQRFPASFEQYAEHCEEHSANELIGTAFVCDEEEGFRIACLFTSAKYGRAKAKPAEILEATKHAIDDLIAQVKEQPDLKKRRRKLCAVKLNAGAFAVPWQQTKDLLEERFSEHGLELTVYDK